MKTIIFGSRETAELARFYFENDSGIRPVAFCEDGRFVRESSKNGLPIVPSEEIVDWFPPVDDCLLFVPLYDNFLRQKKMAWAKESGYRLASYISSKATVFSFDIGENCFILENNVIQPFVRVGDGCMMWSGNHIGHHSLIGNHVFVSSHVVVCGGCVVEDFCWLGVNSSVRDGTCLAEGTFIGMNTCVIKNTRKYTKYFGLPAKEIGLVEKS